MSIALYDLAGAEADRRFSPFCWRTRMALAHKALGVETLPWRFTEKDRLAETGQGKVPVMIDGERWLHDSWEIALYLEKTYPTTDANMTFSLARPSLVGDALGPAVKGFMTGMMLLAGLILRGVAMEFRSHNENPLWREFWDTVFSLASGALALLACDQ